MAAPGGRSAAVDRIDARDFSAGTLRRSGTWTVAFLAGWCPFCREFAPEFSRWAANGHPSLVADVTEFDSPLWEMFAIDVVPTLVVFRDGRPVARFDGVAGEGLPPSALAGAAAAAGPASGRDSSAGRERP